LPAWLAAEFAELPGGGHRDPHLEDGPLIVVLFLHDVSHSVSCRNEIATVGIIDTPNGNCTDPIASCFGLGRGVYKFDKKNVATKIAAPGCPRVFKEAFLSGTEPTETCQLHGW
jgi:hypothetical protein